MKPYLPFLKDLSANNSKEWMDAHKPHFQQVRGKFQEDAEVLLHFLSAFRPEFTHFKPKDCLFRQHRDIRFSANKAPYKTNFAAYFSPKGKKSDGPGWYLHVQPGNSFIAGGVWMPAAETLKKIRKEIDYSGAELTSILSSSEITQLFRGLEGEKLKTSPREYPIDHPYIEYLRMKSFILTSPLSDAAIESGDYLEQTKKGFQALLPFLNFLEQALDEVADGSGLL